MVSLPSVVNPVVRRLASVTCFVALLPIGMGALVTTLKAGMAFADWPSSDGQNMLLYPWFKDFAEHPDKFVEHGHRLAGVLIGLVSVCLAISGWVVGNRTTIVFVTTILLAVIGQGLLGGARVLMDRQAMAMIHSMTGAMFFSLCVIFRLYCSPRWTSWLAKDDQKLSPLGFASVIALPLLIVGQYLLGGLLRHMHLMLNEHIIGAVAVGLSASAVAMVLLRSNHSLLKFCGILIATSLLLQISLGIGSYVTRFGLASVGYVASAGSLSQAIVCSLHTVVGMFLLASSVCGSVSAIQLFRAGCLTGLNLGEVSLRNRGTVA